MHDWLTTLKQRLAERADANFGRGASLQEIQQAEVALGVKFPTALRTYLREFGFISVGCSELFGLGSDVPRYQHLIALTEQERSAFHPCIPTHLLPIENNGAGDHYCLDLSTEYSDPPVVLWSHEEGESQSPEAVCASFTRWLTGRAESAA